MNRIICLILALLMSVVTLASCKNTASTPDVTEPDVTITEATTEEVATTTEEATTEATTTTKVTTEATTTKATTTTEATTAEPEPEPLVYVESLFDRIPIVVGSDADLQKSVKRDEAVVWNEYGGEGVLINSTTLISFNLPNGVPVGSTVVAYIKGSSESNFRVWLMDSGIVTSSNQVNMQSQMNFIDFGEYEFFLELTCQYVDAEIADNTAKKICFKAPSWDSYLTNLQIDKIAIFEGTLEEYREACLNLPEDAPEESQKPTAPEADSQPKETPDAVTLVKEMGVGWNLGNSLESEGDWFDTSRNYNFELAWGNPITTKEMIDKIHELGFDTIRIPVSWGQKTDSDYIISEKWMKRVQIVVDYAIDNGMYVIINSHHDDKYFCPSAEHEEESKAYIQSIWTQIAEHFKDYDYHLIFEAMNEPRLDIEQYEWNFQKDVRECQESARILNEMNQIFIDTVRKSGGNNLDRYLGVTCYAANSDNYLKNDSFVIPDDSVKNRLLISVHIYEPYMFVMNESMDYVTFTNEHKEQIEHIISGLYNKFVKNDIPVYIGEVGCVNKNNPDARHDWAYYIFKTANEYGMPALLWDNGIHSTGEDAWGMFDREALKITDESLCVYNGIMEAKAEFTY